MKTKRRRIRLDVSGENKGQIDLVMGAMPYLWIGNHSCFGCVPDAEVKTLRDMCERILERRKQLAK